jgi:1-acyl-sn-glycerol-3-phosphate acyltransferase
MSADLTPQAGGTPGAASGAPVARRRREGSVFRTGWARTPPANALREVVQVAGLGPIVRREVQLDIRGLEHVRELDGPVLFVANHSSHLDTAVLLTSLPAERRRRTAVAAAADYFFDVWWRATGSSIAFNTFPIERRGGSLSSTPADLLADGWSLVVYPEGTRSVDGVMGRFRMGGAWLAVHNQVPVIPVGLRGTYAAMPRGRNWPVPGRPRVSVRFGEPIVPRTDETPREMQPKIVSAVRSLVAEDEATWWQVQRHGEDAVATPPTARWARIWQQAAPPVAGGRKPTPRIWRR